MGVTIDREQIRRDAETAGADQYLTLACHCLALLTELEQAERERDELHTWWRQAAGNSADAQARLAKVPALVEAGNKLASGHNWDREVEWRAALAAWENERPATPPGVTQGNATGPQLIGGVPWENE